jgi:hypothetical protein
MASNILAAVRQIKSNVADHLEAAAIERLCEELQYVWRQRLLGPVMTLHAFLLQVLHGNTACDKVPHLMNASFTGDAYIQARARLPLEPFQRLLALLGESLAECRDEAARWCGHRVWLLDGSGCSMPDTPALQRAFGQPGGQRKGCGFPVAHLLTLFHASSGLLQKVLVAPLRTHDLKHAWQMHPGTRAGRRTAGRPRLLLLRPFGPAIYVRIARCAADSSARDRELPQGADACAAQSALPEAERRERTAAFGLDQVAGTLRSGRRVVQAESPADLARCRSLCRAARVHPGPRTALPD